MSSPQSTLWQVVIGPVSGSRYMARLRATGLYRACKSRARKRGWGSWGAGGPHTPCLHIGLYFVRYKCLSKPQQCKMQIP